MSKKKLNKNNDKYRNCTYFVTGMHCASCEILIEKKLLKLENIMSVDAALSNGRVNITYKGEMLNPDELSNLFKDSGYTFSLKKYIKEKGTPLFALRDGKLIVNKEKSMKIVQVIFLVVIILYAFQLISNSGIAGRIVLNNTSSLISFFAFGVIAGLSSCAALVGGLLLSMSKQWNELYIDSADKVAKIKPFLMFNIGRIISFIILGGVLGLIGSSLGISLNNASVLTAVIIMVISIVMLMLGLQMLEVKWANKFKFALPKSVTRNIASEEKFKGKYMPFIIGALTFFLPCGFTLIAQGLALTSGSFINGALMMFAFVLGTLPILGIISLTSTTLTKKPHLNALFTKVAGILVVIFAIYNFNSQLNILGFKSLNDIKMPSINFQLNNTERVRNNTNQNLNIEVDSSGVQIVRVKAEGFSYGFVGNSTIKSGVPTKLIVENDGVDGCAVALSARGLFNSYVYLKPGENIIDLGSVKKGSYKITCSMGMVTPIVLKVI